MAHREDPLGQAVAPDQAQVAREVRVVIGRDDRLDDEDESVENRLASLPPLGLAAIKEKVRSSWQDSLEEEIERQAGATVGFENVRVWHCNDAKAARGSRLDRHQHIGEGTIGTKPFGRLLNDKRFSHCAFIAETPVDEPGDEERNVQALKSLVEP